MGWAASCSELEHEVLVFSGLNTRQVEHNEKAALTCGFSRVQVLNTRMNTCLEGSPEHLVFRDSDIYRSEFEHEADDRTRDGGRKPETTYGRKEHMYRVTQVYVGAMLLATLLTWVVER